MKGSTTLLLAIVSAAPLAMAQEKPADQITLFEYRPKSIFKIPITEVPRAKYPVIDMHTHVYAKNAAELDTWVKLMDASNIEKTVMFTGNAGAAFDEITKLFSKYPNRFELWCGLDYKGLDQPGYGPAAVKELERCYRAGARGVGEISDKGSGLTRGAGAKIHPDDPRMDAIWEKCADLGMPVNIHIADAIWDYEPMDKFNDGLPDALSWRLDNKPGIVGHAGMLEILERTLQKHPRTIFIACHFANLIQDLPRLGQLLDKYPNLYTDISGRFSEMGTIPRFSKQFCEKYAGRICYGTDLGTDKRMYGITFRLLETLDEHYWERGEFNNHWTMNGLGLSTKALQAVYRDTALKILKTRSLKK
jgi:uncharacterized protein